MARKEAGIERRVGAILRNEWAGTDDTSEHDEREKESEASASRKHIRRWLEVLIRRERHERGNRQASDTQGTAVRSGEGVRAL